MSAFPLHSQLIIDSIEIKAIRPYSFDLINPSYQKQDSSLTLLKITDILNRLPGGQIQISSPGGLQTFLHRGMSTRHLPVIWQGLNIQSVINNTFDYNLIPASLFNDITFYSFGSPAITGNNAFAGAFNLGSKNSDEFLKIGLETSSLYNYRINLLTQKRYGNTSHTFGTEYSIENNIFTYKDGNDFKKRTTTDFHNFNIVYRNRFIINQKQVISLDFWWQNAHRNIPVSITSSQTDQLQHDRNLRLHINHTYLWGKYKIAANAHYMSEILNFKTPAVDSHSASDIYQIGIELTEVSKNDRHFFLKFRKDIATPNFYTEIKNRNTVSAGVSKKLKLHSKVIAGISLRQDMVDKKWLPFSATALINYFKSSLSFSKNYNLPGFNDLYWPNGGDADLNAEQILQAELSTCFIINEINFIPKAYVNRISDWIQWTPQNNGIWTAINQKKVQSSGLELEMKRIFRFEKLIYTFSAGYAFNRTYALDHYTDKSQIGKQLIYVPKHK
ncbi:MAG: TonB-dependent receptor plug domain-containing protein, partial [Saprospiraceae bacterium]|nr:TonB-dependent receptor plug domain-containing protein [Saprospiraceae bacterium]